MTLSPTDILNLLQTGGAVAVLVLALIGFVRNWWYLGSYVDEIRRERDEARLANDILRSLLPMTAESNRTQATAMQELVELIKKKGGP